MYHKVSKEHDGLLRPGARARGIVVTPMKSPTGGAEREDTADAGQGAEHAPGCPVVALPRRPTNDPRQGLRLPEYQVPLL